MRNVGECINIDVCKYRYQSDLRNINTIKKNITSLFHGFEKRKQKYGNHALYILHIINNVQMCVNACVHSTRCHQLCFNQSYYVVNSCYVRIDSVGHLINKPILNSLSINIMQVGGHTWCRLCKEHWRQYELFFYLFSFF